MFKHHWQWWNDVGNDGISSSKFKRPITRKELTRSHKQRENLSPLTHTFHKLMEIKTSSKAFWNSRQTTTVGEYKLISYIYIYIFRNLNKHRITESQGLQGTSGDHLDHSLTEASSLQSIAQEGIQEGFHILSVSLFQCSVTLPVRKFFLLFIWNFSCSSLCPVPLVLLLGTI